MTLTVLVWMLSFTLNERALKTTGLVDQLLCASQMKAAAAVSGQPFFYPPNVEAIRAQFDCFSVTASTAALTIQVLK